MDVGSVEPDRLPTLEPMTSSIPSVPINASADASAVDRRRRCRPSRSKKRRP